MLGWHHQLNGHEFKQITGVGEGQGSLACCSPWGHKESDTIEQLNQVLTGLFGELLMQKRRLVMISITIIQ